MQCGAAASSTGVDRPGTVAAPGDDDAKRRKVTPRNQLQDLYDSTLITLRQIITNESACVNCLSDEHRTDCPNDGAVEWRNMHIQVRDGIVTSNKEFLR